MEADSDRILAGLEKTCDEFQLKFQGAHQFQPEQGETTFTTYDTPKIELTSKDHKFIFQKLSNRLAVYLLWGRGSDVEPPNYSDKPQWSIDQAIKVGTAFRDVLAAEAHVSFGKPKIEYKPPSGGKGSGMDFHAGYWWIYWSKIDDKGIPFGSNGVQLNLSESIGVTSATTYLDDSYVAEKGEPMSATAAIAIAKKSYPAMGTDSKTIVDYALKSSDLELIRPYGPEQKPCRLAWVIWLSPVRSESSKSFIGYDDSQEVIVDALTGQIIGGDAML